MVIFDFVHKRTQAKIGKNCILTTGFWKRTCVMVSSDFSTSSCVATLCVLEYHRSGLGVNWEYVPSVTVFAKDLLVLQPLSGKEERVNEK